MAQSATGSLCYARVSACCSTDLLCSIQSRNKFAQSKNQQMASEEHKWKEVFSPAPIRVRMRLPHVSYIYREYCKDGCFESIDDMMVFYFSSYQLMIAKHKQTQSAPIK